MAIKNAIDKLSTLIRKYRYVCIVLIAGILLMTLPTGTKKKEASQPNAVVEEKITMEARLTTILSHISGAGKVRVMLTEAAGEETVYQADEDHSENGDSNSSQKDTVIITDGNRTQSGLVTQVLPPKYQGALIVCQGADDPLVRLCITQAVASLTGLGADKITIAKMK